MASTWLPFATRRPGPAWKVGYGTLKATALSEKEGEVKHSMEGTLAGALGVLDGSSQASWHLSIPKSGPPLQHYPLEALTWHAGVKGDRRQDTSLIGNLTLIGEEHEDYPTNALNANQIGWAIKISEEIRRRCPRVAARPPTLRVNLWEHNWLSATSCPSGLIPWAVIIAGLEDDEMKLLRAGPSGKVYTVGAGGKRHIGPTEWAAWKAMGYTLHRVADADIAKIPDLHTLVQKTPFKPTGYKTYPLRAWIESYHKHRLNAAGAGQTHVPVSKHMADAAEHGIKAIARPKGTSNAAQIELLVGGFRIHVTNLHTYNLLRKKLHIAVGVERIPLADPIWKLPLVTAANMKAMLAGTGSGGMTEAQVRAIAIAEDSKLKVTK